MTCKGVSGKQTELEFAYSLWSREGSECRGPLAKLTLRGHAFKGIVAALDCLDASRALISRADGMVTAAGGRFEMCAAHWYDVAMVVGGMAEAHKQPVWQQLNTSLFIMISKAVGWDYREVMNRFTSFRQAKLAGK